MMDIKNIPGKLKTTCSFCVWKFEKRNGQKTKMPYNPATGERAKINDLRTFQISRIPSSPMRWVVMTVSVLQLVTESALLISTTVSGRMVR